MKEELYIYETQKRAYGRGDYQVKRKAKRVICLDCGLEWIMRADRKSPIYCRECSVKGERNPCYGKEHPNKGKINFDAKAYCRNYQNQARHELKKELIRFLGNKCVRCQQENLPICVWHFHHKEGEKKLAEVSQMMHCARKKLYDEVKKCELICANCHYIYHRGDERLNGI